MGVSLLPQYWYVVGMSREVTQDTVLACQVLDESLVAYRDAKGLVVVAQDRCIHRCAKLSCGTVQNGQLTCGYHGWQYGANGEVTHIPSEPEVSRRLHAKTYPVVEQDGYVYVSLAPGQHTPALPYSLRDAAAEMKGHVQLKNHFKNSLANCVENYIDVPHTAYVHHGIFRKPKGQPLRTTVTRDENSIHVEYQGETLNLGSFSWFLNPSGKCIVHTDHFYAPNITHVRYLLPNGYRYAITSQSVPIREMETMVYTDIHYDFGIWTPVAGWLVKHQAQSVIDQDIEILGQQGRNIEKYGESFYYTSADVIHQLTREMIDALKAGHLPSSLPPEKREIVFNV